MTRRKKCDDFWLPGAKSFPMIYIMNDFAAIIFRHYYTLKTIDYDGKDDGSQILIDYYIIECAITIVIKLILAALDTGKIYAFLSARQLTVDQPAKENYSISQKK